MKIKYALLICAMVALLSACGGGGGGDWKSVTPVTPVPNAALAAGVHRLTFTALSTARLDVPITAIQIAVQFPSGLSVSTTTGGSGEIIPSARLTGTALVNQANPLGIYTASTRIAFYTVQIPSPQTNFRGGQYLSVLFNVPTGSTITPNDIYTIAFPEYRVVGIDSNNANSGIDLTGKVRTTLDIPE